MSRLDKDDQEADGGYGAHKESIKVAEFLSLKA